jgi:hypothetical protein
VIHYHGTPITPRAQLLRLTGRSFCVSFVEPRDVVVAHEIGEGVMLDNGAFTFWRRGRKADWPAFYAWAQPWLEYQTTWAIIPDVIDGDEDANDALIAEWPFGARGAPVWHMHEDIDRLVRLAETWPRVCLGSSGEFATVGDPRWHARMRDAMDALCGDGPAPAWLHMLRGLRLCGGPYPFASADSTNIAQNHNGNNTRRTPKKDVVEMATRMDALQCPARWHPTLALF